MRRIAAALAVLVCLTLTACGGGSAGSAAGQGFVAGDGSIVLLDAGRRVPAPDVVGTTLDGSTFTLSEHRGEVVALNVWASWCAPCRAEAPALEQVWTEYKSQDFLLVGLDTRDSAAAAQAFIARFAITYPSVVDTDGQIQLLFASSLPPQAIPSTVIIDKQGRVAARILGEATEASLSGIVDALLEEPA